MTAALTVAPLDWLTDDARCVRLDDPDLFFSPAHDDQAREVCRRCPLRTPCAEYATENGLDGIWGGTSRGERVQQRPAGYQRHRANEIRNRRIHRLLADGVHPRDIAARLDITERTVMRVRSRGTR